jgi:hypothetical protein
MESREETEMTIAAAATMIIIIGGFSALTAWAWAWYWDAFLRRSAALVRVDPARRGPVDFGLTGRPRGRCT